MDSSDNKDPEEHEGFGAAQEKAQEALLEELTNRRTGYDKTVEFLCKQFPFYGILQTFEANQPYFLVIVGMFIYAMQQFAFVINPHFSDAWGYILGDDIATILYSFHFPLYDPLFNKTAAPTAIVGMIFALLALGLVLYLTVGYCRFMTGDKDKQNPAFVYFNRMLVHSLTTWMLIPLLQLCFVSLVCGPSTIDTRKTALWMYPGDATAQCWGSIHAPSFIAASLFLLLILPLLYLALVSQFDASRTEHPKCRRHTFVDDFAFAHSLLSAALFQILLGYDQRGAFAIIHCISASIVAVAHWYYLPYCSTAVNQFFCIVHSIEALTAALLAAAMLNSTFLISGAASPLLLGLGPFAAIAAFVAVNSRVNPMFQHRLASCHVERALQEMPNASQLETGRFPIGLNDDSKQVGFANMEQLVKDSAARISYFENADGDFASSRSANVVQKQEIIEPFISVVRIPSDVDLAASFVSRFKMELNENPTIPMLQFAARIYTRGLVTFNSDSAVLCAFASFILHFVPPMSFFGMQLIDEVARNNATSLPLRYRAHVLAGFLRTALGIKNQAHVLHSNSARTKHCTVLVHMNDFWLKLTEPSVNIGQVSDVADHITTARHGAVVQFRRALQHQTSSDAVLIHRLGEFLEDVMLDNEAAAECYNEAKEIREARQARSMRGTRQITAVETDVDTLTERLLKLLLAGAENTGFGSGGLTHLVLEVSLVYAVLLVVSILFLFVAVQQKTADRLSIDQVYASGMLRATVPLFDATVQSTILNGTSFTLNSSITSPYYADLASQSAAFSTYLSSVSAGSARATLPAQIALLRDGLIPTFVPELDNAGGMGLWSLAEVFLTVADQLTSVAANITAPTVTKAVALVANTVYALSSTFDYNVQLYEQDHAASAQSWLIWTIVLFVVGIVTIFCIYFAFLISLQRTALGRIFTFQLFTLIPFEALEKLAAETKSKILAIQDEQKPKSAATEETHKSSEDDDDSSEDSSRKKSSSSSIHNSVMAASVALKSCLKKPGQVKTVKKVVITNVVEIFGSKDETAQNLKKDIVGAAAAKAASTVSSEEDTERLLMKKAAHQPPPPRATKSLTTFGISNSVVVVSSICLVAMLLAASVALLGALVGDFSSAPAAYDKKIDILNKFDRLIGSTLASCDSMDVLFQKTVEHRAQMFAVTDVRLQFYNFFSAGLTTQDITDLVQVSKILRAVPTIKQEVLMIRSLIDGTDVSTCGECMALLGANQTVAQYIAAIAANDPSGFLQATNLNAALNGTNVDFWSLYGASVAEDSFSSETTLADLLGNIRSRYSQSIEDSISTKFESNAYMSAALALLCVATSIVCALMFMNVAEVTGGFVTRSRIGCVAIAFVVPLALVAATTSMRMSILPAVQDQAADLAQIIKIVKYVQRESSASRVFAGTGNSAYFYDMQGLSTSGLASVPQVLSNVGALTPGVNSTWSTAQSAVARIKQLTTIASALTMHSLSSALQLEAPMLAALASTDWNYVTEPNYVYLQSVFPSRTPRYANRSSDYSLSNLEQWKIAISTVTDDRFTTLRDTAFTSIDLTYGNVTLVHTNNVHQKMNAILSLTIVSIAVCAIPIVALVMVMANLGEIIIVLLGLKNNTAGSSVDNVSYSAMVTKAQYSLVFMGCLLCACFGLGIWQSTVATDSVKQVDLATRRDYLVGISLFNVRKLLASSIVKNDALQLSDNVADLIRTNSELYFGSSGSKRFAMGRSLALDQMTFGATNTLDATAGVFSTFGETCDPTVNMILSPRGPFSALVNSTIHQALQTWTYLLFDAAAYASQSPPYIAGLKEIEMSLSSVERPLLAALQQSTQQLMKVADSDIDVSGNALLGVSAAFIAGIVLMYTVIFLPMVSKLAEEGESARLLLRMIPVNVREQVPAIAEYIETGRIDNAAELQRKFEASERLLQNILPQKIASRLKSGEQPIADMHRCLTILFTDFVGFTKRSSTMQAPQIVDFLNEVFLEFDTVVELLELEKIKTIGDAYFMAGGLDPRMTDHAMRVVEAAFLFFEALRDYNLRHPGNNPLQMRLGIHTGPAVAGVIGTKKVAYDLWGESVEIANAMESTGVPGCIHISEDTAKHVEGFYRLEPRGELPREKEHIPDCMPATFLIVGRLLPTPYQHIQRPKMLRTSVQAIPDDPSGVKPPPS